MNFIKKVNPYYKNKYDYFYDCFRAQGVNTLNLKAETTYTGNSFFVIIKGRYTAGRKKKDFFDNYIMENTIKKHCKNANEAKKVMRFYINNFPNYFEQNYKYKLQEGVKK